MAGKFLQEMNDEELAAAMCSGYRDALGILYDKYAALLFGFINRIAENEQEAERVLQFVFINAWKEAKKFDARKTTMLRWLMEISRSVTLKGLKLSGEEKNQLTENIVFNKGNLDLNGKSVQVLSANENERAKAVLELIYLRGTTVSEVADLFGMEDTEVKFLLRIAFNNLRGLNKNEYHRGVY